MEDLKILLPGEMFTLNNGEQILIKPVPFGKLRIFSESVTSLVQKISEKGIELENIGDWKLLFDFAFDETVKIMALILDKPRIWFDTITISDGLGILNLIIEQNFNENAKKKFSDLIMKGRSVLWTQSSSSSSMATAGRK